jgi:hypothetical protein
MYIITALAKMATRFSQQQAVAEVLLQLVTSNDLEVQQRSGEMLKLLAHRDVSEEILAPIEDREATGEPGTPKIVMEQTEHPTQVAGLLDGLLISLNDPQDAQTGGDIDDLLSLGAVGTAAQRPAPQVPPQVPQVPQPVQRVQQVQQPIQQIHQPVQQPQQAQPTEMARLSDFIVYGQAKSNPKDPRQVALNLFFSGTGATPLTDFKIELQMPPGWQVRIQPADKNVLAPAGGAPISQIVYLLNLNNSPFQLQLKASYRFGSQPLTSNAALSQLPPLQ